MQDFPIFTTEYGVASLILKEIPYRETAYIRIRDARQEDLSALLKECVSFCRMAGGDHIYAAGHEGLAGHPLHCSVLEMRGEARVDPGKLACLFPVTEATVSRWREIYNRSMSRVDNAATLESREEKQITESGGAYFIHREGRLLGIGWLEDTRLLAVASVERGWGDRHAHPHVPGGGGHDDPGGGLHQRTGHTAVRKTGLHQNPGADPVVQVTVGKGRALS